MLGTQDLWLYDVARGIGERLTFHAGADVTPSDRMMATGSRSARAQKGAFDLYRQQAHGAGADEPLVDNRHQPIERITIAGLPFLENLRDFRRGRPKLIHLDRF